MRQHAGVPREVGHGRRLSTLLIGTLLVAGAGWSVCTVTMVGAAGAAAKHHSKAISKHAAAAQYLADDAPFAAARTSFESAFTAWFDAHEASSQTTSFVDPFVAACQKFERELDTQHWPAADRVIVRRFAGSLGVIATDVETLPSVTVSTGTAWAAQLKNDSATSVAYADQVRKELGLSAAS